MINVIKITDSFAQIEVKGVTITFTEPHTTVKDKYLECTSFIDRCIAHAITIYQSTRVNPIGNPPLPRPDIEAYELKPMSERLSIEISGGVPCFDINMKQRVNMYRDSGFITSAYDAIRVTKPLTVGVI